MSGCKKAPRLFQKKTQKLFFKLHKFWYAPLQLLGAPADANHEHAGGERIQRPPVSDPDDAALVAAARTDLARVGPARARVALQNAANVRHDVLGRPLERLGDGQQSFGQQERNGLDRRGAAALVLTKGCVGGGDAAVSGALTSTVRGRVLSTRRPQREKMRSFRWQAGVEGSDPRAPGEQCRNHDSDQSQRRADASVPFLWPLFLFRRCRSLQSATDHTLCAAVCRAIPLSPPRRTPTVLPQPSNYCRC